MPRSDARYLSADVFTRTVRSMTLRDDLMLAAYSHMVDRLSLKQSVEDTGLSRQSLQQAVRRIWDRSWEFRDLPADWVTESVSLPQVEMKKVQALSRKLREALPGHSVTETN